LAGNPGAWRLAALATAVLVVMLKAAAPTPSSTDAPAPEVKHLRSGLALAVALIVAGTIGQH
jgi:anti-sigma-K factor RskA